MDRILIILKTNGPRASSAPVLGLNTINMFIGILDHPLPGNTLYTHWYVPIGK